jgi:hypothetical protein
MRCHIFSLALTIGLVWAMAILVVASANLFSPDYGRAFLEVTASLYPGYHPGAGVGSVVTGTLYALVDGTVGGAIFGWVYNALVRLFAGGKD